MFLDAAERVLPQLPNAIFAIVGNNPYVTEAGFCMKKGFGKGSRIRHSVTG